MALFNLTSLAPTLLFAVGAAPARAGAGSLEIPTILAAQRPGRRDDGATRRGRRGRRSPAGRASFERTPKFGVRHRRDDWRRLRYQLGIDRIVIVEAALAVLNAVTCLTAIAQGSWAIAIYTAIFAIGLSSAVALTVGQTVATALAARRAGPVEAAGPA